MKQSTEKDWYCHHIEEHSAPEQFRFYIDDDFVTKNVRSINLCRNCLALLRDRITQDDKRELAEYVETRMRFSVQEMK